MPDFSARGADRGAVADGTILARDLSKLGQTVEAAASAGANTVSGISFGLQNPQKAEDEARIKAVAALKAKSDLYARATGYKVVHVKFANGKPVGGYDDFLTGFAKPGTSPAQVWGRPAGLAVAKDGSLLVADDAGKTVWRVAYTGK